MMSNNNTKMREARAAVPAPAPRAHPGDPRTDPTATVVVPVSVWEDQQRTIRELSAIVAEIQRDARDRETVATLRNLRAEFAALRRPGDRESDDLDAEFAVLFAPRDSGSDSPDPEFSGLFPPNDTSGASRRTIDPPTPRG